MARADLVLKLIQSGLRGDSVSVRRVAETIAADERAKKHDGIALAIEDALRRSRIGRDALSAVENHRTMLMLQSGGREFLVEKKPIKRFEDLVLAKSLKVVLDDFCEEYMRSDILADYSLTPRNKVLLIGAPGNGKTSLAEAIAEKLMIPLFVVKYESIIGSYLGETASRICKLFDYVKTRRCVLFLDEFDSIGKERGDVHDVGEVKRVVSTLLLKIDDLPSHVVAIGATNHPELLDRAVWRRFQLRVELHSPGVKEFNELVQNFERKARVNFGFPIAGLFTKLGVPSFAEAEELCLSILRKHVLLSPHANLEKIARSVLKDWKQYSVAHNAK